MNYFCLFELLSQIFSFPQVCLFFLSFQVFNATDGEFRVGKEVSEFFK